MLLYKALELSIQKDLDLVEVSPNANPPVCKILDYGKFRYQIQREKKKFKKKQHIVHVKEIRLRPAISDHDLLTKLTKAKHFIEDGCKLKFTVFFRGRERSRMDTGLVLLERVIEILDDFAKVEKSPDTEANKMTLIMVPK
jgi:translation initiation factor IF-3